MKITLTYPTNRGLQLKTFQCFSELMARGDYDFEILVAGEGYNIAENRS